MSMWTFRTSRLIGNVITLEFDRTDGRARNAPHSMSVTIPMENANHLAAGVISALRAAEQRGSQIPPIDLGNDQMVSINDLQVSKWGVSKSPDLPGRVFLHLLAAEGLADVQFWD